MLLRKLVVTNSQGLPLDLPLAESEFFVKDIQGLGPVKATLVSSSFATMDGAQYHSSRREPRNVIIKLGLAPDMAVKSVKELRDQLYNYFMTKSQVNLRFSMFDKNAQSVLNQYFDVDILGRVESNDPTIFTKESEMDVSLLCFNPDFVDINPVIFEGVTVPDLTEVEVPYAGSVESGTIFTLLVDRDLDGFTIYHRASDDSLRTIDYQQPLLEGDVVRISSVRGSKYARMTRGGVESSVLSAIDPQSGWFELQPGSNSLRVYTPGAPVPYKVGFLTKYGGL